MSSAPPPPDARPDHWSPAGWLHPPAGRFALAIVLALAAALRVSIWLQARSIFLDEANLLRNYAERGYAGLFHPLRYEQYAPPLFSGFVKGATALFGYGELATRLVPLLASLAALGVLAVVARRWLTPLGAVLAMAFVGFGAVYLELATTVKQYSSDMLGALALLALADYQLRRPTLSTRAALAWAAGGAALVWFSMPAVFGLAGVGAALAWRFGRRPVGRVAIWARLGLVGAGWALSFGAYFLLLLRADAHAPNLQQYHQTYFLAFPPRSAADWHLLGNQLLGLVDRAFGKTTIAAALAAAGVLLGVARLARHDGSRLLLLTLPLLAALSASALHYYSLIARLMLFAMPALVLLILTGLEVAFARRAPGTVIALLLLVTLGNQQRLASLFGRTFWADYADVRTGLRHVAAHQQPGEVVFIYHNAAPVAYYYQHLAPLTPSVRDLWLQPYRWIPGADSAIVAADVQTLVAAGHRRLWFVHDSPTYWLRRWAQATGTVTCDTTFYRGYAFRWEAR